MGEIMTVRTNVLAAFAALAAATFALPAAAAIVVGSTPINSPIAATGFETFVSAAPGASYVDGGVVVGNISNEMAWNNLDFELADPHGVGSWGTVDPTGYISAKLQSGGTFNSFSGFFGSEVSTSSFVAQFRLGGASVGDVNAGTLTLEGRTLSFSGFTADEVWFQVGRSGTFSTSGNNNIGMDDLAFGVASGAVPEPATWALMITGFGLAGARLRRRSRSYLAR